MNDIDINPYERIPNQKIEKKRWFMPFAKKIFGNCVNGNLKIYLPIMAMIFGFRDCSIGGIFSVSNFLSITVIIFGALNIGSRFAASAGIVLGTLCTITNPDSVNLIGILGFCGFVAGMSSRFRLPGVTIAFIIASTCLKYLSEGITDSYITMYEIVFAAVILMIIPKKFSTKIAGEITKSEKKNDTNSKITNIVTQKLNDFAWAFSKLSNLFADMVEKGKSVNYNDIASIFDTATEKICRDCSLCLDCWELDFNSTYQTILGLFSSLEYKENIEKSDVPEYFASKCKKLDDLIVELNTLLDVYRTNNIWLRKTDEHRDMLTLQFKSFSDIINKLIKDIDRDVSFDAHAERMIKNQLINRGVKVIDVTAVKDHNDRRMVDIQVKKCNGTGVCLMSIKPIIKEIMGCNIRQLRRVCNDNCPVCNLKFIEKERFGITIGVARRGAQDQNGDNHSIMNLENGKYAIIISDGLGIGTLAAHESIAATELLRSFLEIGFEQIPAVKFINAIMIMRSSKETFATLDVCILDLYAGEAEFIKMGAAPTYLRDNKEAQTITGSGLPIGIVSEIRVEHIKTKFKPGNDIVMVSDGIENKNGDNDWLKEFITNVADNLPPQAFAEQILNRSIEENGHVDDDITVIDIRIKEDY